MQSKKFTNLLSGEVVEIKDQFEDIVILNDNSKIKLDRLLDKNYFEEAIDPNNFFKNTSLLQDFAQKIKQIPDDVINSMGDVEITPSFDPTNPMMPTTNESAVLPADPELERAELMRKYNINPIEDAKKQMNAFDHLLNGPGEEKEEVQRVEVNRSVDNVSEPVVQHKVVPVVQKVDDPIITMFKNVKRNVNFKMSLNIEGKVPRKDFIEMMEDSYNTSIIEFLADEFLSDLLKDPKDLKDKIVSHIKDMVYKKTRKKTTDD